MRTALARDRGRLAPSFGHFYGPVYFTARLPSIASFAIYVGINGRALVFDGAEAATAFLKTLRRDAQSGASRCRLIAVATERLQMHESYLEVISLLGRVHRQFLDVVNLELDRLGIHDVNGVQGLILFNISDAEMTISELGSRGHYLGTNLSYNVKKLVENAYLSQKRAQHDRRSTNVRITDKGAKLRDQLKSMHQRHVEMLERDITDKDLHAATVTLRQLERYWTVIPDLKAVAG